jgi:hypothetical protein
MTTPGAGLALSRTSARPQFLVTRTARFVTDPLDLQDPRAVRRQGVLRQLDGLSFVLDNSIRIPGTRRRFGLDPVIGLIPGVGDAAGMMMSAYIVVQAARLGAPAPSLVRMLMNVGIEALAGAVPVAGDLFDAWYKANARNVAILRAELEQPGSTRGASRRAMWGVVAALLVILGAVGWLTWRVLSAIVGVVA